MLAALLLFSAVNCDSPWFPTPTMADTKLVFYQTSHIQDGRRSGSTMVELHEADFDVADGEVCYVTWIERNGDDPVEDPNELRCTEDGLVPADRVSSLSATAFRGVQFASNLEPGAEWSFGWTSKGDGWTLTADYHYRVVGTEKISVPAGTFEATRVDYTATVHSSQRGDGPMIEGSQWIAPGLGLIKQIDDDPALGFFPDKTTLVLVSKE